MKYGTLMILLFMQGIAFSKPLSNPGEFNVTVQNKTTRVINLFDWHCDHGSKSESYITHVLQPGAVLPCHFKPNYFTGVEGTLKYYGGQPSGYVTIYYNNPLIGQSTYHISSQAPLYCEAVYWNPDGHILNVEITEKIPEAKPIDIGYNTNGLINGTIYWNKQDIESPAIFPVYKAFEMKAFAPTQFVPGNSSEPGTKGTYNGQQGVFTGTAAVGNILYTVDNSDQNYFKINYSASGIPVGLPLDFDIITSWDIAKWTPGNAKKNKPDSSAAFIVGTFPVNSNANITLNNNFLVAQGVDFMCEGDWMTVDGNGNPIAGVGFTSKIEIRKNAPVLPGGMLSLVTVTKTSSNGMMQPAATKTNEVQTKQVQGAVQKVRIRN